MKESGTGAVLLALSFTHTHTLRRSPLVVLPVFDGASSETNKQEGALRQEGQRQKTADASLHVTNTAKRRSCRHPSFQKLPPLGREERVRKERKGKKSRALALEEEEEREKHRKREKIELHCTRFPSNVDVLVFFSFHKKPAKPKKERYGGENIGEQRSHEEKEVDLALFRIRAFLGNWCPIFNVFFALEKKKTAIGGLITSRHEVELCRTSSSPPSHPWCRRRGGRLRG